MDYFDQLVEEEYKRDRQPPSRSVKRKPVKSRNLYKLKKGMKGDLDAIYNVLGLAGGDWWEHEGGDPDSDRFVVVKDVEFEVIEYRV